MAEPVFKLLRCDAEASHMLGWAKKQVKRVIEHAKLDSFQRTWSFGDVTVKASYFAGVARLWLEAAGTERMAVWATLPSPTNFTTLMAQVVPMYTPPPEPPVASPPGPSGISYGVFMPFYGWFPGGGDLITHGSNWWERDGMSGTTTAQGTWSIQDNTPVFTPSGVYYTSISGSITAAMAAEYTQIDLRDDQSNTVISGMGVGNWETAGTHDGSLSGMSAVLTANLTLSIYTPAPLTYHRKVVMTSAAEVVREGALEVTGGPTYPTPWWDGRKDILFYTIASLGGSMRGPTAVIGAFPTPVDIPSNCLPVADHPPPYTVGFVPGSFSVGTYTAHTELNSSTPSNIGVYLDGGAFVTVRRLSSAASYVNINVGGQETQIDGTCAVSEAEGAGGRWTQTRTYDRYVVDARRLMSGVLALEGTKTSGMFIPDVVLSDQRTYEWLFLTDEYRARLGIVYDNEKQMQEDMWYEEVYAAAVREPLKQAAADFVAAVQAKTFAVPVKWETYMKHLAPIAAVRRGGSVTMGISQSLITDTPEYSEQQRTVTLTTTYPPDGGAPPYSETEVIAGSLIRAQTTHIKEAGYEWEPSGESYTNKYTYSNWFTPYGWQYDSTPEVMHETDAARALYDLMPDVMEPAARPNKEVGLLWNGELVPSLDAYAFAGTPQNNFPVYNLYTHYAPPVPLYTNTLRGEIPDILCRYYRAVPQKNLGAGSEPTALERYWLSSSLVPGSYVTCVFIAPIVGGISMGCFACRNDFQTTAEFEVVGTVHLGFSWETGRFSVGEWNAVGRRFVSAQPVAGNALLIYGGIKWDDVKETARAQRKALNDPEDPAHDPLMKAVLDALKPPEPAP